MKEIPSKIYYDTTTGDILIITSEMFGMVEETTKEQDYELYPQLKNKNINNIDFIKLEYGTFNITFQNIKSHKINLELKTLECEYYSVQELKSIKEQDKKQQSLNYRVYDISDYLYQQSIDTIEDFENYILHNEINKIIKGVN